MRTLFVKVALCAAVIFAPTTAKAQGTEFEKLAKIKGVEYVHMDKNAINSAIETGSGLNLGNVVNIDDGFADMFDDLKVFSCEEKSAIKKFEKEATKFLKDKKWQSLIDTTDEDGEKVRILQAKNGEKTTTVIFAVEENEAALVIVDGKFNIAEMMGKYSKTDDKD